MIWQIYWSKWGLSYSKVADEIMEHTFTYHYLIIGPVQIRWFTCKNIGVK